ncbi:MAG: DUF4188 domain-containing protein [Sphingomonas sp.]|nr:DUF4188 domain-containing protein [Sphingomonas sp.]
MADIIAGRMTANHSGDIAVFIIGMRVNRLLAVGKWLPVFRAMGAMLGELHCDLGSGFLAYEMCWKSPRQPVLIQYWESFDALEAYAADAGKAHRPAWTAFNRATKGNDAVGIFHETYVVRAGASETLYNDLPAFGLGKAKGLVPATGNREAARNRMAES